MNGRCPDIDGLFFERLASIPASEQARAYVAGVFSRFAVTVQDDMSKCSVVVAYADATFTGSFDKHRRIGDWALWSNTFSVPDEVTRVLGQRSYEACYRILRGQWVVYEELASGLPDIASFARKALALFAHSGVNRP